MQANQELSLTELFRILKKRKTTFFTFLAIILVSTLIVSLLIPPLYKAKAKIIVQNDTNLYPASVFPVTSDDKVYLNTQKEIMSSSFLINKALDSLRDRDFFKKFHYEDLKNRIAVSYLQDSNILEVGVYLNSPTEAVKLANTMVDVFMNYHANSRQELVDQTLSALNRETALLNKDIEDLKNRLKGFSDKEEIVFYQSKVSPYLNNILELENKNALAEADIKRIEKQVSKNENIFNSNDTETFYPLLLVFSGSRDTENPTSSLTSIPWMQDMKKKLSEAQANLARLRTEYTEGHPAVKAARDEIFSLRQDLVKELRGVLNTYSEHYEGYIRFLKTLKSSNEMEKRRYELELRNISSDINKAATKQIEYNALLKNFDIMQGIYAVFARKQNELQLLRQQDLSSAGIPNLRVFELASSPLKPVSPNLAFNLVLGFCFGIFIGVSGSILEERNKASVSPEDGTQASQASSGQERRSMSRKTKEFTVAYEIKSMTVPKHYATTENLSGTGISIKTEESLDKNDELTLWIKMKQNEFIRASGEVIWVIPSKAKKAFSAGVRFTEIDPQEREKLINYLYGEHYLGKDA